MRTSEALHLRRETLRPLLLVLASLLLACPPAARLPAPGPSPSTPPAAPARPDAELDEKPDPSFVLQLQTGHTDDVRVVAISPDGRLAATGANDRTVILWDLESAKLLRRVSAAGERVAKLAWSADSRRLLALGERTLSLFDVETGERLCLWDPTPAGATILWRTETATLSADGRAALLLVPGAAALEWPMESNPRMAFRYPADEAQARNDVGYFFEAALTPDRRTAFVLDGGSAAFSDKPVAATFSAWDLASGTRLWRASGPPTETGVIAVSSDGRLAAFGAAGSVSVFDSLSGTRAAELTVVGAARIVGLAFTPDGSGLRIVAGRDAVREGREVVLARADTRRWELEVLARESIAAGAALTADVAPGGRVLLSEGDRAVIWEMDSASRLRTFDLRHAVDVPAAVALLPDGRTLLEAASELRLRDIATAEIVRRFGEGKSVSALAVCARDDVALVGREGGGVSLLPLDGSPGGAFDLPAPEGEDAAIAALAFSPDCSLAAAASWSGRVSVFGVASRTRRASARLPPQVLLSGGVSGARKDGWLIVRRGRDRWALVPQGREELDEASFAGRLAGIGDRAAGPDGMVVERISETGVRLEEPGREPTLFGASRVTAAFDPPRAIAFTPAGDGLVLQGSKARRILGLDCVERDFAAGYASAFSADLSVALAGGSDGAVALLDLAKGVELRRLRGHESAITAAAFAASARRAVTAGEDGSVRIWDIDTGASLVLVSRADDWILFSPDGYFDASRTGGELVGVTVGGRAYGIEQFAARTNRPDILLERFGLSTPEVRAHFRQQVLRRHRRLGPQGESRGAHVPTATITRVRRDGDALHLDFTLADDRDELRSYNVFVNDVPLHAGAGVAVSGRSVSRSERVPLVTGENVVEVSCVNSSDVESLRAVAVATRETRVEPDLYVLAFGVSDYREPRLKLRFAHRDAESLVELAQGMKGRGYREVFAQAFVDGAVTPERIREAGALFARARPEDVVLLFVAGHGTFDLAHGGGYYYLPWGADPENLAGTGVPYESIEALVQGIAPRSKLVLLDTCDSGELEEIPAGAGTALAMASVRNARGVTRSTPGIARPKVWRRDRFVYNDLARRTGAIVLSSSRGGEPSFELEQAGHGVFTDEILKALGSDVADKNRDGAITSDELREHVARAVPQRTSDQQHPTVDRDNLSVKITLPIVRADGDDFGAPEELWVRPRSEETEVAKVLAKRHRTLQGCMAAELAQDAGERVELRITVECNEVKYVEARGGSADPECVAAEVGDWWTGLTPAMCAGSTFLATYTYRHKTTAEQRASQLERRRGELRDFCAEAARAVSKGDSPESAYMAATELLAGRELTPTGRAWLRAANSIVPRDRTALLKQVARTLGISVACPEEKP